MNSHTRGLLIGAALGLGAVAGFGAAQSPESEVGRYRLEVGSDANRAVAYVIDTSTGKVWQERPQGFVRLKLNVAE